MQNALDLVVDWDHAILIVRSASWAEPTPEQRLERYGCAKVYPCQVLGTALSVVHGEAQ